MLASAIQSGAPVRDWFQRHTEDSSLVANSDFGKCSNCVGELYGGIRLSHRPLPSMSYVTSHSNIRVVQACSIPFRTIDIFNMRFVTPFLSARRTRNELLGLSVPTMLTKVGVSPKLYGSA